jgi:protein-S-isoprenylcysteine O-methyltransferase Ste14
MMIQRILAVLFLVLAFNAYRTANRRGIWSWSKFFIVVISIVAFPLLLIVPLSHPRLSQWAGNHPGIATAAILIVIFAFVGVLAYLLRKKPTKT